MSRYVLYHDAALHLAATAASVPPEHQLLAPALLRSQVLSQLRASVRRGELTTAQAEQRLDRVRALRLRLLGDRVLQRAAWQVADELGWDDTFAAEYVALTRLQADALVTLDPELAAQAARLVPVARVEAVTGEPAGGRDGMGG